MEAVNRLIEKLSQEQLETEVLPKRAVTSDYEQQSRLEPVNKDRMGRRKRRMENKKRREATTGLKWFDLPKQELDDEKKLNLEVLRLRSALNPKRFYKRKAIGKDAPDYFQVGTVVEHPAEFYSHRVPRKERKRTIVDELLADAEFKKTVKRRYNDIHSKKVERNKNIALARRRQSQRDQNKRRK